MGDATGHEEYDDALPERRRYNGDRLEIALVKLEGGVDGLRQEVRGNHREVVSLIDFTARSAAQQTSVVVAETARAHDRISANDKAIAAAEVERVALAESLRNERQAGEQALVLRISALERFQAKMLGLGAAAMLIMPTLTAILVRYFTAH